HPDEGMLPPDVFIPSAEASGLIIPIGEWVERTGVAQIKAWRERFGDLMLAINMSARQFHERDLSERLVRILSDADLEPAAVEVEITESMALFDAEHAIETIRKLKRIGAKIAIDDFGTGHSSLNYLRRFRANHIKIDRSFVAGIGGPGSDDPIVKAIVAMGHSLGLR